MSFNRINTVFYKIIQQPILYWRLYQVAAMQLTKSNFNGLVMIALKKSIFDTVCHPKLLKKITTSCIRGITSNLIASYLQNRKQYVSVNGVKFNSFAVKDGAPQGSILGTLLYIILC